MDCDLLIYLIYVDCTLLTIILYCLMSSPSESSASPPAPPLLEACSPVQSLEIPWRYVEPQVEQPLAAPALEDPAALPPASDPFAPSRPVGSFLAPPTFGITRYPRPTGSPLVSRCPTYTTDIQSAEAIC
ncbi:hypothetical protein PO909_032662 [Leuciscus waleckii]